MKDFPCFLATGNQNFQAEQEMQELRERESELESSERQFIQQEEELMQQAAMSSHATSRLNMSEKEEDSSGSHSTVKRQTSLWRVWSCLMYAWCYYNNSAFHTFQKLIQFDETSIAVEAIRAKERLSSLEQQTERFEAQSKPSDGATGLCWWLLMCNMNSTWCTAGIFREKSINIHKPTPTRSACFSAWCLMGSTSWWQDERRSLIEELQPMEETWWKMSGSSDWWYWLVLFIIF